MAPNKKPALPPAHLLQIKPKNKVIATVIIISAAAIPSGNGKRPETAGDMYSGKAMMNAFVKKKERGGKLNNLRLCAQCAFCSEYAAFQVDS